MFEALTRRYGPLPGWVYGAIVAALAYYYFYERKKKAAAAAAAQQQQQSMSNTSTTSVPVSNLTTTAQPMPIQLGDTFINTGSGGGITSSSGSPNTTLIGNSIPSETIDPGQAPSAPQAAGIGA